MSMLIAALVVAGGETFTPCWELACVNPPGLRIVVHPEK